ncbi:sugar transferase [Pontibacter silvestris]|uniref:Sugar transferase n=1 Tax=Pontibacter silvestris TaxID=2305183 RepID=A0ABW4WX27_9BACT|nr:sugar transferase [Pontibacter silvestris]
MRKKVVYLTPDAQEAANFKQEFENELDVQHFGNPTQFLSWLAEGKQYDAIFNSANPSSPLGLNLVRTLKKDLGIKTPIFWLANAFVPPSLQQLCMEAGVSDIFYKKRDKKKMLTRLYYLSGAGEINTVQNDRKLYSYKLPLGKRVFDIVVSLGALICLSPLFLVIALLVKLESKGPIFYYSYRVGTGYKIFKFWKFRSMRQDADKLLANMKGMNQYQQAAAASLKGLVGAPSMDTVACTACVEAGIECQNKLIDAKGKTICEKQYLQAKKAEGESAFIKIANDPRITRIGMFIRNTSIDELPQLYNVLRGDMSIIGNRPLPLYEAEKITTDQFAARFIAPAGITGLWQVSKRGKGDMSEEERKALDIEYAANYSLKKDVQILLKTIPALFQKENV